MQNGAPMKAEWKTYCCIHSNARDFAKLGQLFLDDGKAYGDQILNFDFINQMKTPTKNLRISTEWDFGLIMTIP
jgi:CubicO group peptidase (beta-lactamase class C family)